MSKNKKSKKTAPSTSWLRAITSLRASLLIGASLLVIGLAIVAFELITTWRAQQTSAAAVPLSETLKSTDSDEGEPYISGIPVQITVPSTRIDLKVIPGYYNEKDGSWTLTLNNAQWGTITKPANDKGGMTFIYAHYRKGVFLNLPKIKPGEVAMVKTDEGHTFTYTFRSSTVTSPNDTSIFTYQGKPILVLQTCTGVWYQNRQLFVFDLTKVE